MKPILKGFCTLMLLIFFGTCKVSEPKYSRIKIFTDQNGIRQLSELGLALDHGEVRKGVYFIGEFNSVEIKKIKKAGFEFDILVPDLKKHYADNKEKP